DRRIEQRCGAAVGPRLDFHRVGVADRPETQSRSAQLPQGLDVFIRHAHQRVAETLDPHGHGFADSFVGNRRICGVRKRAHDFVRVLLLSGQPPSRLRRQQFIPARAIDAEDVRRPRQIGPFRLAPRQRVKQVEDGAANAHACNSLQCACVMAALLLIAQLTAAPHWPGGARVAVWIDAGRAPVGAAALVERAMKTWSDASNGELTLVRASTRADAAIRILFVQSDTNYGEAAPRVDPASGFIVRADVAINAAVPDDPMDARIIVYLTALHELGHALGLAHSDTFSAIMYRFRRPDDGARYFGADRSKVRSPDDVGSTRATGLDVEDVAALRRLYAR